jgi:hypothetical protein
MAMKLSLPAAILTAAVSVSAAYAGQEVSYPQDATLADLQGSYGWASPGNDFLLKGNQFITVKGFNGFSKAEKGAALMKDITPTLAKDDQPGVKPHLAGQCLVVSGPGQGEYVPCRLYIFRRNANGTYVIQIHHKTIKAADGSYSSKIGINEGFFHQSPKK